MNNLAFHYDASLEYHLHPKLLIGKMTNECGYCKALKFKKEVPSMSSGVIITRSFSRFQTFSTKFAVL